MSISNFRKVFSFLFFTYPIWIYISIKYNAGIGFKICLLAVVAAQLALELWSNQSEKRKQLSIKTFFYVVLFIFVFISVLIKNQLLMLLYPALMSASAFSVFSFSLFVNKPILGEIVKIQKTKNNDDFIFFKKATIFWVGWLALNTFVSLYTAFFTSLEIWLLYNSILFYVINGFFIIISILLKNFHTRNKASCEIYK